MVLAAGDVDLGFFAANGSEVSSDSFSPGEKLHLIDFTGSEYYVPNGVPGLDITLDLRRPVQVIKVGVLAWYYTEVEVSVWSSTDKSTWTLGGTTAISTSSGLKANQIADIDIIGDGELATFVRLELRNGHSSYGANWGLRKIAVLGDDAPTMAPTRNPTAGPTQTPTLGPSPLPSADPTAWPTAEPSFTPTTAPTIAPTLAPTAAPTLSPTESPTMTPTTAPTTAPTAPPTNAPSSPPTKIPTVNLPTPPTSASGTTATQASSATPTLDPRGSPSRNSTTTLLKNSTATTATTDGAKTLARTTSAAETTTAPAATEPASDQRTPTGSGAAEAPTNQQPANDNTNAGGGAKSHTPTAVISVLATLLCVALLAQVYKWSSGGGAGTTTATVSQLTINTANAGTATVSGSTAATTHETNLDTSPRVRVARSVKRSNPLVDVEYAEIDDDEDHEADGPGAAAPAAAGAAAPHASKLWFHGRMTAADAEPRLADAGLGAYLVREVPTSTAHAGALELVLSVRGDHAVAHVAIKEDMCMEFSVAPRAGEGGSRPQAASSSTVTKKYRLDHAKAAHAFSSVDKLLQYYQSNKLAVAAQPGAKLVRAAPRDYMVPTPLDEPAPGSRAAASGSAASANDPAGAAGSSAVADYDSVDTGPPRPRRDLAPAVLSARYDVLPTALAPQQASSDGDADYVGLNETQRRAYEPTFQLVQPQTDAAPPALPPRLAGAAATAHAATTVGATDATHAPTLAERRLPRAGAYAATEGAYGIAAAPLDLRPDRGPPPLLDLAPPPRQVSFGTEGAATATPQPLPRAEHTADGRAAAARGHHLAAAAGLGADGATPSEAGYGYVEPRLGMGRLQHADLGAGVAPRRAVSNPDDPGAAGTHGPATPPGSPSHTSAI